MAVFHNGTRILLRGAETVVEGIHCTPSVALADLHNVAYCDGDRMVVQGSNYTPHPHQPKCSTPIQINQASADTNVFINGMMVAKVGDIVNCGALTRCTK